MTVLPYAERPCKLCSDQNATAVYRLHQTTLYCCPRCDLHFIDYLDPDPPEQESEHSLSTVARQYIDQRQAEGSALHSARLALLVKHISLNQAQLLDLGAGIGQFQQLVERQTSCKTYGIEPSSLRRQYALENFGLKLFSQHIDNPLWQSAYLEHFNAITLWDVIEHVNDPLKTLYYATRLLKPGGIIALDTPNRQVFPYRISETCYSLSKGRCPLFLEHFYAAIPFGHKQIFTTTQLINLAARLELDVISTLHSYTRTLFNNRKIILILQKRPSR